MSTPVGRRLSLLALLLCLSSATRADAQVIADGGGSPAREPTRPIAAWLALGLGSGVLSQGGSGSGSPLAGVLRANLSIGRLLVMARASDVGPFLGGGPGVSDMALLVGVRSPGRRAFLTAAGGVAAATPYQASCFDCGGGHHNGATVAALAFDVGLHANYLVPGVAAGISGAIGPSSVTHAAFTVAVELGWFGQ